MSRIDPRPIIDLSRADQQPTQVVDLSRSIQLHTVRLEVSETLLAELREAPAPQAVPQPMLPPAGPASHQSGDTLILQPATVDALAFAWRHHPAQPPVSMELGHTLYDGGALRERAAQLASTPEIQTAASKVASAEPARKEALGVPQRALATLRASSLPKRAALALLPLAIAGAWAMPDQSASASAPSSPALVAVAAPARPASKVVATAAQAASVSPATAGPATTTAKAPTLERSVHAKDPDERLALIAAASGNKAEAAALYDRLAERHNCRTFALAARLVRGDRVRKP